MVKKIITWYDYLFYNTYSKLKQKGEKDAEAPTIAFLTFCGMNFSTSGYLIILWLVGPHKYPSISNIIYFAIISALIIYGLNFYFYVWKNRINYLQRNIKKVPKHVEIISIFLIFGSVFILYGLFFLLQEYGGMIFTK